MPWQWRDYFSVKYGRNGNPSSDRQVIKYHTADLADHAVCTHKCLTKTWCDILKQPTSTGKSRRWCVQEQPMTACHTKKGARMNLLRSSMRAEMSVYVRGKVCSGSQCALVSSVALRRSSCLTWPCSLTCMAKAISSFSLGEKNRPPSPRFRCMACLCRDSWRYFCSRE